LKNQIDTENENWGNGGKMKRVTYTELLSKIENLEKQIIQLKEEDEKLKELEQIINNSAAVGIRWVFGEGWPVTFVTKSVEQWGYTPEEFLSGQLVFDDIVHPDDIEKTHADGALQREKGHHTWEHEYRIITKKGDVRWVKDYTWIGFDELKSQIKYFQGVILDITERKRAENVTSALYSVSKAAHSTKKLSDLYNSIHKSLGTIIDTKNFYIALYHKEDNTISFPYFIDAHDEAVPTISRKEKGSLTAHVIDTQSSLFIEEKGINEKFGKYRIFGKVPKLWVGVPLKIRDEVIGVMAVQSYKTPDLYSEDDITLLESVSEQVAVAIERKRAEEELRAKQQLNELLLDSLPHPAMLINKKRVVLAANKIALEVGTKIGDYCWKKFAKSEYLSDENKKRALKNPHEEGIHCTFCLADKALKDRGAANNPEVKAFEKIWDYYWIPLDEDIYLIYIIDITERKKIEEEGKRFHEQLFQAQKMESIERLAGGIAHDFNNICTSVLGYAELLKMKFPDPSADEGEAAEVIIKGIEKAANLTWQLLGFAQAGKYFTVPLNINNVIKEILNVTETIFEKKIKVIYDFNDNIGIIKADENQIKQTLTDIIINAKDAMPAGGDLIIKTENVFLKEEYVSKYPELKPGKYVKIAITDTGIGIPEEIKGSIFEPFFTTKGVGKGTGLGLATVYGIIKNHNGHIICDSSPGKGTTFSIYLPAYKMDLVEEKNEETEAIRGSESILVIDDEKEVRTLVKKQFEGLGYKVILAKDGVDALKIYKKKKEDIDIVLLDMIMPNMAGEETFFELKKINPEVKVLLFSGFSQDERATEILNKGALDFIKKPANLKALSETVRKALKK